MTTALRAAVFALAPTHVDLAVAVAKNITDEHTRALTIGYIVEVCVKKQNDPVKFTKALEVVKEIKHVPTQERALHRINRHAEKAGLQGIKEPVEALAKALGGSTQTVEKHRQTKDDTFKKLASEAKSPLQALFYASQVATKRDEAIREVQSRFHSFSSSSIEDKDYEAVAQECADLQAKKEEALKIADTVIQSKKLGKIARLFVSMCKWFDAKQTIMQIEDPIVKAHATDPSGSIVRLVDLLNSRRKYEFTNWRLV